MKKAPKSLFALAEDGNVVETAVKDLTKNLIKEFKVKEFVDEETQSKLTPAKIVESLFTEAANDKDLPEGWEEYTDLYAGIKELITTSHEVTSGVKDKAAQEKAEAKAKRDADKAAEEEKEKLMLAAQETFITSVSQGTTVAQGQFSRELEELKSALPEGIRVAGSGDSFGIEIEDDTSNESIGQALGYLFAKQTNSTFIGNQLHFFIGDLAKAAVERGIYVSGIQAGKHISEQLLTQGHRFSPRLVETCLRLVNRCPVDLRNPKADPTAYIEIANAKQPKRAEKETENDYASRLKTYEKDRQDLFKQVKDGFIVERKQTLEPVKEMLYKHGIIERPSGEPEMSVNDMLKAYFHLKFAADNLVGLHAPDKAIYAVGGDQYEMTKEEVQDELTGIEARLANIFYSDKSRSLVAADFIKGEGEITTAETVDGKVVQVKKTGKVYPKPFFSVAEPEAAAV